MVCTVGGSVGNVLTGSIDVIASSLPGIDLVRNNNALTNGTNSEDDAAFRNRFQNYLASLSKATLTAVLHATANVRQGLDVVIEENVSADLKVVRGIHPTTAVSVNLIILPKSLSFLANT